MAWSAVSELLQEGKWSLNDSLNEIAFCRQIFHSALAPRPRVQLPQPRSEPKKRRHDDSRASSQPPKKSNPPPKRQNNKTGGSGKWEDSWRRKTSTGQGICIVTVPVPETSPAPPAECKREKQPCSNSSQSLCHDHMGRFFLDIFAGASMPVSSAVAQCSADRFEPLDIIHGHDLLDDEIYEGAMQLASSGLIGAGLAAPYCCHHSRAKLKKPGPKPLRTPTFLDGVPDNSWEDQLAVQESSLIHDRARSCWDVSPDQEVSSFWRTLHPA